MNSNSRGHYEEEKECGCKKKKEEGTKVILKCKAGNPVTVTATSTTTAGVPGTAVITPRLATATLDTGAFHDPCILFEFANNITITASATTATSAITFQLNRLCKGETIATAIGNPWVYSTTGITTITDIITFKVCDCDSDSGCDCDSECCTYFISASTVSTAGGTGTVTAATAIVTFNNPTLVALVVEG
ncbi:DUF4489 domain-containing protein [Clostridium sp.]|uniref:DUF4489 domain-containing protein n=1 Tax=Clostridium sp. TaxID=1506 RepID=UPI00260EDC43|nr:DUF4489 domain-containing protein [uncultured Clostridium sp.]